MFVVALVSAIVVAQPVPAAKLTALKKALQVFMEKQAGRQQTLDALFEDELPDEVFQLTKGHARPTARPRDAGTETRKDDFFQLEGYVRLLRERGEHMLDIVSLPIFKSRFERYVLALRSEVEAQEFSEQFHSEFDTHPVSRLRREIANDVAEHLRVLGALLPEMMPPAPAK